jgi:hypothetical protein
MKKQLFKKAIIVLTGVGLITGSAVATPVYFDIDENNSSVGFTSYQQGISVKVFSKTYTIGNGSSLSVDHAAGLDDVKFTLNDNTTSDWFNFLTFTANGTGIGFFDIATSLAFESPIVGSANGVGEGGWGSVKFLGAKFSGGFLNWDDNTIELTDSWGNSIVVEFEEGIAIQANTSMNLKARITNYGGGTAPVPEPTTMLLFGTGLLGFASVGRKKIGK